MNGKVWGLDIGATGIKAVEVTRTWRGRRVTNYGFFPFTKEKDDLRKEKLLRLQEVVPQLGKDGEGLILPVPSHRTMVHRVALPFRDRKKNEQVVKYEIEPLLPFPIEEVVVDYHGRAGQEEKEVLAFAIQKEVLGEEIALLKESGLDPEAVVPESLALFWLAENLELTSGQTACLLDLGQEKTTLLIWQDSDLTLVRSLAPGKAGAEPSKIPDLDRLAQEVKRSLLSYQYAPGARPVETIYLSGGGALWPGVEEKLGELLNQPVSRLNLGPESPFFPDLPEEGPSFAAALGAALGSSSSEPINFRREEFSSPQKAEKARTRLKVLVAYAVILGVLAMGSFFLDLVLKERKYQALRAEIRKEFSQARPDVKKVVNEVQQLKAGVKEEKARLDSLGVLSGTGSPLDVIRELSQMMEPAWKIRVTDFSMDSDSVEVSGEAESFDAVNQLKNKLDRSPLYREVQLKTARASGLENVIEFKLQMKRGT